MPRKYSQSELENLYEQFGRELPQLILEKMILPMRSERIWIYRKRMKDTRFW